MERESGDAASIAPPTYEELLARVAQLEQQQCLDHERLRALINSLPEDIFFSDADGQIVIVDQAVRASLGVADPQGRTYAVAGISADISERKRAEEALRESEARMRSVLTNLPKTVVYQLEAETDGTRRFTCVSDAVTTIYGCTADEAISDASRIYGQVAEEERERVAKEENVAVRTLAPFESESRLRPAAGQVRWVRASSAPRQREDGGITWDGVVIDITEHKRIEQEREHQLAEIAEANEAKDLFFNSLSHELRTPLAAMRNAVELLRHDKSTAGRRMHALDILERNIHHQTSLIGDLLDLSGILRGKVDLKREPLDLRKVVTDSVDAVEADARRAKLSVDVRLALEPVPISADVVRLVQIICNLMTNALKYTAPGGRVTVSVGCSEGQASVSVRDTGIGIAADVLPRIFEPFRQVDTSLARTKGGLGIGLGIARSLAEQQRIARATGAGHRRQR